MTVGRSEQQVFGFMTVSGKEITGNLHNCNSEMDLGSSLRSCDPDLIPTQNWNTAKEHVWMLELGDSRSWSIWRKQCLGSASLRNSSHSVGSPLYYAPQYLCPL